MNRFVVPQFIDVEDKIIGPLTTRQFLILLVTGLVGFLEYKLADFGLFLLTGLVTLSIGGIFAFFKVNGMPVHYFLLNFLQTSRRPKVRVWQKDIRESELKLAIHPPVTVVKPPLVHKPPPARSRLQELSLEVDTGGAFKADDEMKS